MDAFLGRFRLADKPGTQGLTCGPEGVSLAGVPLLRKTLRGFAVRSDEEIGALMLAAYGEIGDRRRLVRGLRGTAAALNRGDSELAMIAAVHLRLRDLDSVAASRIAAVDDFLVKYDPDEPRDRRGRWTTGGFGGASKPAAPRRAESRTPRRLRAQPEPGAGPRSQWDGVSHPTGGHFILTGGAEDDDFGNDTPSSPQRPNEPRWEMRPDVEPPPDVNTPNVPPGWDVDNDGRIERRPKLRTGKIWPPVMVKVVVETMKRDRGAPPPKMWIFVPRDGKGPPLVGSTPKEEFELPPGYDRVELIGMPQETFRRGSRSDHADDSVEAAIRFSMTNRYSKIYFNSALSTSTNGEIDAPLRPDVFGVVRPELDLGFRFKPYESYSPGQTREPREMLLQLLHADVGEPEGNFVKFLLALWMTVRKLAAQGGGASALIGKRVHYSFLTRKRNPPRRRERNRPNRDDHSEYSDE